MAFSSVGLGQVKVAGQMLIDLNYTRGIATTEVGPDLEVDSWTNFGVTGGSFVRATNSPYSATLSVLPPFIEADKGGAGINVPNAPGVRALVADFQNPPELQGNSPYSVEAWLWKNAPAGDQRGVFAWTANAPPSGDAGKLSAGNPAVRHNNGRDLNWTTVPPENVWNHLAVTFDGTTERLYLNGQLQSSATHTLNVSSEVYYPMLFSGIQSQSPNNTSFSLNGAIAAVRVHSDALSPASVADNHAAGVGAVSTFDLSVKALPVDSVTGTSATLNGNLFSTSSPATTVLTFYYGTTDPGSTTSGWAGSVTLNAPNSPGDFFAPVTGLAEDSTYFVRVRSSNGSDEAWSAPTTFKTPGPPKITNLAGSPGTGGNASVRSSLDANGYPTTVKLFWGATDGGTVAANWTNEVDLGPQESGELSYDLTGLEIGVNYYYTFQAANQSATVFATPSTSFQLRSIPAAENLLFSAVTEVLPESGPVGNWPTFFPAGQTLVPMNAPAVKQFGGVKWARNLAGPSQGFRLQDPEIPGGNYVDAIPVNGVSVVVAVRPLPRIASDNWDSVVDIFYNRVVLGVRNHTGQVCVFRNGFPPVFSVATLPENEVAILSMVIQPDGAYQVWANGVEIMNIPRDEASPYPDMDFLIPNVPGPFANAINIGRNNPDGWPVFNGDIGDVFVYKTALETADRESLEASLTTKFVTNATLAYTITATAGANGAISPSGAQEVIQGDAATFTISADSGYVVQDVVIDGVSVGPTLSYTFTNVSEPHSISASFVALPPQPITATAGPNGSITPSGVTNVTPGADQTYIIAADSGYRIADVVVNGSSVGTPSTYTFSFVVASHTIEVSFSALSLNIPRSSDLLFSVITDDLPTPLPGEGTGDWPLYVPSGQLTQIGSPGLEVIDDVRWLQTSWVDGDGFRFGAQVNAPIPINGASIVTVVQPLRNGTSTAWTSVVDIFYNRLVLGVRNDTGQIVVWRNQIGGLITSGDYLIPDGQETVLSLVVQPTGEIQVHANGLLVISENSTSDMTTLNPLWNGGTGFWSFINVGRNNPDGWTTFNGNIGDVFVYKTALADAERLQMEALMFERFDIVLYTVTASSSEGGTISPSGSVQLSAGKDHTFAFEADQGFAVGDVLVNGESVGAVPNYTFVNLSADSTISVVFERQPGPPNDDFANAIVLPGPTGVQTGTDTDFATLEPGEPDLQGALNTVWFRWTAPADGTFTVSTLGSRDLQDLEWDSILGAYTGESVNALTALPGTPLDGGIEETMEIQATAGTTYHIQVAGFGSGEASNIVINWTFDGPAGDPDYTAWAAGFLPADVSDPLGDFDNDGLSNADERAFGLDPTLGSAANPISVPFDPAEGTFSYTRRLPSLTGLTYRVWTSTNLGGWQIDAGAVQTPGAVVGEVETVSVRISEGLMSNPTLFIQVRTD